MRSIAGTQTATARTARQSQNAAWGKAEIPAVLAGVLVAARPAEVAKPKATPTGATRTRKVAELHRCRCSELVLESGEWTGCESMVKGTFAPGHDAKAASLVVRGALEASDDPEVGGKVYDEAAQCWRSPLEIFEGTKLGQKVAARLGQAEAKQKQAAEIFSHATGASEAAETESMEAEKAAKPGKVVQVVQHRRAGATAGMLTTNEPTGADLDEVETKVRQFSRA
jgi:hypothetical protein